MMITDHNSYKIDAAINVLNIKAMLNIWSANFQTFAGV